MAENFDDFGDFASALPTTGGVNEENSSQTMTCFGENQVNSASNVEFFASFSPPPTSSDVAPLDFTAFSMFQNHTPEDIMDRENVSSFHQIDVANMDLTELKIPSLTDPGVHIAGGVAFDIPPLLDSDFSDPSSPTEPSSQVQFQSDLFSTKIPEANTNHELNETPAVVHLPFQSSGPHQTHEGKKDSKDDSIGEFESSLSLEMDDNTLKYSSNTEPSNLGIFPNNTVLITGSNVQEAASSELVHGLGGDLKSDDDFGEFGGFTQSTNIGITETPTSAKLANSLDAVGLASSESTANDKKESTNSDTITNSTTSTLNTDAIPPPVSDGFACFQSSEQMEKANKINAEFGKSDTFSSPATTISAQENGFETLATGADSTATLTQDDTLSNDFGIFSAGQRDASAQSDSQFGDFGAFSSSASTNTKDDTGFGNFGAFQTPIADSFSTQDDAQFDEFGTFSSSTTTSGKEENFGNFGAFQQTQSAAPLSSTNTADEFGAFADSNNKDDDFGDFSMSGSGFGNFASSETTPKATNNTILKGIENILSGCFPGAGSSQDKQVLHTTTQLTTQLSSSKSPNSSDNDPHLKVWTTLQTTIDFTVPLQKWDSSYMQDRYFVALKMDPMLISKAGVLPMFNSMGQFGAPLGGVTALDLLESFGFEGGLEAVTQEPSSPTSEFPFRSGSPGPALLDLSLPASPNSPTNKNASFTLDADLLELDLNVQSQTKQLTSIQELVLNERLVVNRSTWMDSELLELGDASTGGSTNSAGMGDTSSQTSSRPSTPRAGNKQNSIELQLLQLGLDASKTSLASASSSRSELSLTARSTLGRLPDLSFMLQRDKIVRSTYQSGQSAT